MQPTNHFIVSFTDQRVAELGLKRATSGSAAYDLCAAVDEPFTLAAGETFMVSTGIRIALPPGFGAFLIPRSGSGSRGLVLGNTTGLIDSDYRGVVFACLWNRSKAAITVNPMDRVVQMVIKRVETDPFTVFSPEEFDTLSTERGSGGFGSTGGDATQATKEA